MIENELLEIAHNATSDIRSEPGRILYSSHETLKHGLVYLMGFNPGGSEYGQSLESTTNKMLASTQNAYLDEIWGSVAGDYRDKAPLQNRVIWLLENLGLETKNVCATNLIFIQSRDANKIPIKYAEICWPVHLKLLEIVKPKLIIVFGNSKLSPYDFLKNRLQGKEDFCGSSGHGKWALKGFECSIEGRKTYVAGFPHLSRYQPNRTEVLTWLKVLRQHLI